MPYNEFGTNHALTVKQWEATSERLFRDAAKESYFMPRFAGEDTNNIMQVNKKFEKSAGDKVTFAIRMRQTDEWLSDNDNMVNNEGKLDFYDFSLTLDRIKTAISVPMKGMSVQRVQMDLPMEAKSALQDKVSEKIDKLAFSALEDNRSKTFYTVSGAVQTPTAYATAKTALTATEKITPEFIMAMRTYAKTGGNRSFVPIRPVKVDGSDFYVLLTHPDTVRDLKLNSTYAQAKREADERGKKNPIFTGAVGVWDGVIIHEHENISIGTNAGAGNNIPYSDAFLLGAQSLCWAWGPREDIAIEDQNYQQKRGFQAALTYAVGKPVFNSNVYGSLSAIVSRTRTSDL